MSAPSSSVLHAIGYHPSWETDEDDTADDGRELSLTTSDAEPDTDKNIRTLHEYRLRMRAMTSFTNRPFRSFEYPEYSISPNKPSIK